MHAFDSNQQRRCGAGFPAASGRTVSQTHVGTAARGEWCWRPPPRPPALGVAAAQLLPLNRLRPPEHSAGTERQ